MLQVTISLSSDEVMLIASTFLVITVVSGNTARAINTTDHAVKTAGRAGGQMPEVRCLPSDLTE